MLILKRMSFSGFSEDDIRKLSKAQDGAKTQKGPNKNLKKVNFKPNHLTNASKSKINGHYTNNVRVKELPENARLSAAPKIEVEAKSVVINETCNEETKNENAVPREPVADKKFKDLDEFEAKQKLIEEQNRKRKELLAKALADRTKQTQEEAQRLNEIQEEFKKLDAMLSGDVKILRKQIELASIEYTECQKRYQRIEKEFLDAKVLLHQRREKKEMLTEHLCTIIEKNEERKAEKLTELLNKLQLPENGIKTSGNTNGEI